MSSERCNYNKSFLICSSHVNLGPPLLLFPSTMRISTVLTGAVVGLLFTCPNHRNLPSFILPDILVTPNFSLKTSFLIWSNLVYPYIHLGLLISAISILRAYVFLIAQQSIPYNIAGLTATL
ncbi:hypothetical protein Hanom_Chr03g00192681 [Helianthus anomalus]